MTEKKKLLVFFRFVFLSALLLALPGARMVVAEGPVAPFAPHAAFSGPATAPSEARAATVVTSPTLSSQRIDLTINDPRLRKIPIAIPAFTQAPGKPPAFAAASEARGLCEDTLLFTGLFKALPPESHLVKLSGGSEESIRYADWSAIGAELLITGEVGAEGQNLSISLRLFDPVNGRMIFGRQYPNAAGVRGAVMKFCAEVMRHLTGSEGVFNTRIAFVSTGSGNKEIHVCDFDGANPVQVTSKSRIALSPDWSGDGRYIAYTAYRDGAPHIYILDRRTNRTRAVVHSSMDITPRWRPGAFEMAATLSLTKDPEIYTLTGDGKIIKRLTDDWGIDVSPAWSPDGAKLVFVSNRSGSPQIYTMNPGTGAARRLTFSGKYNTEPRYSPDGKSIAFTGEKKGVFHIFVMGAGGENPTALTSGNHDNQSPTWSPDGNFIAFSSTREGPSRIYIMNATGQNQRRLFRMAGEQTQPAWSPRLFR